MSGLDDLADVAAQSWREDAACATPTGIAEPFIDVPDLDTAEYLIRRYCHRCPVLSDCNAWADTLRPQTWLSVYGGRVHGGRTARHRGAS